LGAGVRWDEGVRTLFCRAGKDGEGIGQPVDLLCSRNAHAGSVEYSHCRRCSLDARSRSPIRPPLLGGLRLSPSHRGTLQANKAAVPAMTHASPHIRSIRDLRGRQEMNFAVPASAGPDPPGNSPAEPTNP
jgi:hypothetical protein